MRSTNCNVFFAIRLLGSISAGFNICFLFHFCCLFERMAGKEGGKKKPLKQKKTDKGIETDEDRAFKAKQKEEQAALKAMREKLGKKK